MYTTGEQQQFKIYISEQTPFPKRQLFIFSFFRLKNRCYFPCVFASSLFRWEFLFFSVRIWKFFMFLTIELSSSLLTNNPKHIVHWCERNNKQKKLTKNVCKRIYGFESVIRFSFLDSVEWQWYSLTMNLWIFVNMLHCFDLLFIYFIHLLNSIEIQIIFKRLTLVTGVDYYYHFNENTN